MKDGISFGERIFYEKRRPVLLYDGDCPFCRHLVGKWGGVTRKAVSYEAYQKAIFHYPQVKKEQCCEAVQLILMDGRVFSAAHAVFKALSIAGKYQWLLWSYEHLPFFDRASEWAYRMVACHREFLPPPV